VLSEIKAFIQVCHSFVGPQQFAVNISRFWNGEWRECV